MITSPSFTRLVRTLKHHQKTTTVVETCCGGLINASLLAQPGASAVYWGGSVSYNTRKAKPFLLNDNKLHEELCKPFQSNIESEAAQYIESKLRWTALTSQAFCEQVGTDFCIAEGGASGPTFRPLDLETGFCVVAVAGRVNGQVQLLHQQVVHSTHANREANMRFFADQAADIALESIERLCGSVPVEPSPPRHVTTTHLDRATHLRGNTAAVDALRPSAKYILLHQREALFEKSQSPEDHRRRLAYLGLEQVESIINAFLGRQQTSFLGMMDGQVPVFGVDFDVDSNDLDRLLRAEYSWAVMENTRTVAPLLDSDTADNELVLYATALAEWQRRSKFCSMCAAETLLDESGSSRTCPGCGTQSWPRQDPSMIVVVGSRDGERVLLARSPRHPERMATALAGFVEAGETMEKAVAREVYEETGIRIDLESVQYIASQPWPFPQSTMIGFTATADDKQPIVIDPNELVEAKWFNKEQVAAACRVPGPVMQHAVAAEAVERDPTLELLIPPSGVLARQLIENWLHR